MEEQSNASALHHDRYYYDPEKKMTFRDQRYLPRWEVNNRIAYQVQEQEAREAVSHDLSSVGICLRTQMPLPLDEKVKITVYLSQATTFHVEGHVVWSKGMGGYSLSGVIFENITPEIQELILQYAFEVKREDLVKHWFSGWDGQPA